MHDVSAAYRPRNPEATILYSVVAQELETFLARQQARDRGIPKFVESEFRSFLECGVLEYGFLRVHCDFCHLDRVVPYSCKGPAFCPSCGGRRMVDTAARLVDSVFPDVPVRQWVLSLPFALRYRLPTADERYLPLSILNDIKEIICGQLRSSDAARIANACGNKYVHGQPMREVLHNMEFNHYGNEREFFYFIGEHRLGWTYRPFNSPVEIHREVQA